MILRQYGYTLHVIVEHMPPDSDQFKDIADGISQLMGYQTVSSLRAQSQIGRAFAFDDQRGPCPALIKEQVTMCMVVDYGVEMPKLPCDPYLPPPLCQRMVGALR